MGHHHLVALLDEIGDGPGGMLDGGHLLGQVLAQGIAAQGDDDALTHDWKHLIHCICGRSAQQRGKVWRQRRCRHEGV